MNTEIEKNYIKSRRELIRREFDGLNEMQLQAVMATEGPLLVLAGAGSGKTTVLINRVANLLKYGSASDCDELPPDACEQDIELFEKGGQQAELRAALEPVDPWRILAITFTNKAAGELKDRLEIRLGEKAKDIWACTFHSACVRILRRDAEKLGFSNSFTIYDTDDSLRLIKQILKDKDIDEKQFPPKSVLGEISRAKDSFTPAGKYVQQAKLDGDFRRIKISGIYQEYMRRLFAADAMDFDDLIFFTVKLLQEHDDVCEYWQRKFRYIHIDEYQDTNHLQYLLVSLLSAGWGNICVVGDDDQSIYKFRGATIENILSFEKTFPGCRTIRLEENYRSTGHILGAANEVIRNNLGRKGKELWTKADTGDKVELYVADNEDEEAQFVSSVILRNFGQGENFREHAVLYRMNAQSNRLEYAFKRAGIPYRIIGGIRFFDRAEVKDALAYLNVIQNTSDDLRLMRIINVPARGIGDRTVETIRELAGRDNCSMYEIISRADRYPELRKAQSKLEAFSGLIEYLRAFSEVNTPDMLFDEVLESTGYLSSLCEKKTDEDAARAENVKEIKSSIIGFMNESGDETLRGYLENVALYTDLDSYDRESDSVVMMTMHSAKGLEFENVFIVGMEETIFPGMRAIGEPEEMEEERRLCYVAITRAKHRLYMVCARQRMLFGRTTANKVSRFVDEIPEEHINKNIPGGYGYSERSRVFAENEFAFHGGRERVRTVNPPMPGASPASAQKLPQFALGDTIRHKAFGMGIIVKMTPMGGDYLIEIQFESGAYKKLMLRAAAQYMEKV